MFTNTLFSKQMKFAKFHEIEIIDILNKECLMHIIKIEPSNLYQDLKESTDLVIDVKGGKIATRIRRYSEKHYRDFTIRTGVYSKVDTEIDKLRKGWCDWYFYAWLDRQNNKISSYILVDLKEVRYIGFFDKSYWITKQWKEEHNKTPNNTFIPIPVKSLDNHNCIVKYRLDRYLAEKLNIYYI